MNQDTMTSSVAPMLWTFLAGAAVGAVVVALTTPKTGPELRGDLKDLARRARRKASDLAEDAYDSLGDLKDRAVLAAAEVKRGKPEGVNDLRS